MNAAELRIANVLRPYNDNYVPPQTLGVQPPNMPFDDMLLQLAQQALPADQTYEVLQYASATLMRDFARDSPGTAIGPRNIGNGVFKRGTEAPELYKFCIMTVDCRDRRSLFIEGQASGDWKSAYNVLHAQLMKVLYRTNPAQYAQHRQRQLSTQPQQRTPASALFTPAQSPARQSSVPTTPPSQSPTFRQDMKHSAYAQQQRQLQGGQYPMTQRLYSQPISKYSSSNNAVFRPQAQRTVNPQNVRAPTPDPVAAFATGFTPYDPETGPPFFPSKRSGLP